MIRSGPQDIGLPQADQQSMKKTSVIPAPLADYIGDRFEDITWKSIGMGVKQSIVETSNDATARLLYIPPGTAMPDHGHSGTELTLVLQGAFADEDDYFAAGDIEVADGDVEHAPVAADGEPCICLAVTEAPLKLANCSTKLCSRF